MRAFLAFLIIILSVATAPAHAGTWSKPRTAIILAFDPEWQAMTGQVAHAKTVTENGAVFITGDIGGQPVVLMKSGVSMVNAAMNTQLLLDRYKISRIVFSGIAGGVDPALHIGDVVVAEHWSQPMEAVAARETPQGFAPPAWLGGLSDKAHFAMFFPRRTEIAGTYYDSFPADPALLELSRKVAAATSLKACATTTQCLDHAPQIVVGGEGVSAAAFIDNADYRQYLYTTFHARVTDMETAAVAQVAYANHVPFIAFRSLSDLAGGDADTNQMTTFMTLASENSAAVVVAFVKALGE